MAIRRTRVAPSGEELYRRILESVPDVLWTSAVTGETTYISPIVERVYGFTAEEICANGEALWFGRIHPDDRESVRGAYEQLFASGAPFDREYRVQRKDGEWIWVRDRAYATHHPRARAGPEGSAPARRPCLGGVEGAGDGRDVLLLAAGPR